MRIAVLGKGNIGGTVGRKWQEAGHDVLFGVRSPDASAVSQTPIAQAIDRAEVVLFAVPASAVDPILDAHAPDLGGRILIDATNDLGGATMSFVDRLVARVAPSNIFRAFNSLGWENFADPTFGDDRADLFYCGASEGEATQVVETLIGDVGLRPIRLGDLDAVELLDSVTKLWFALAVGRGMGRHTAFKVLSDRKA